MQNQERKTTMKAINERLQEGLDYFMENETWRSIYEDAPEG